MLPLFNGHDDVVALALGIVAHVGADDAEVGIAVLQIKAANELLIGRDLVGIIDVGRLEEGEPVHLGGLHEIAQTRGGEVVVAREIDGANAGLAALVDSEDHVHAAIGQIDGAGGHRGVGTTAATIEVQNALDIGLHSRGAIGAAALGLDFGRDHFALELAVALESDAVDQLIFRHIDDDAATNPLGADSGEQAGGVKLLDGLVDAGGISPGEIIADRFSIDALAAAHLDGLGIGARRGKSCERDQRSR